jgi:putative membrane protein
MPNLIPFFAQWGLTALSLWVTSFIFDGIQFDGAAALIVAALVLGFANAIVKPILVLLTLPLTALTMGLFLLVINALVLMLVSTVVSGFTISSFWTAFFAGIFISVFSLFIGASVFKTEVRYEHH